MAGHPNVLQQKCSREWWKSKGQTSESSELWLLFNMKKCKSKGETNTMQCFSQYFNQGGFLTDQKIALSGYTRLINDVRKCSKPFFECACILLWIPHARVLRA